MRKPYRSDLTDAQWELIRPLLPPAKRGGRPRTVELREVVTTLFYQARTGCQGDYVPHDLAAKGTVWDYFTAWHADGTWQKIVDALRVGLRQAAGREDTPSAGCIDSQTVKTTEMGGDKGYDGGKPIKGRKRHLVVDTLGLLLAVAVTAANLDDGTHAPEVLGRLLPGQYPRLKVILADNKYTNKALDKGLAAPGVPYTIEVVTKAAGTPGFVPVKIRWVVERAIAWLGRCRRLSKDYEYKTSSSEAWVQIAAIQQMTRKLRPDPNNRQPSFKYPKKVKEVA